MLLTLIFIVSDSSADIDIHYLDVGQGDCTIIVADGESMIIDGGSAYYSDKVYSYIKNTLNIDSIKYMIATHPHEDHIGGLAAVLKAVPVSTILSPVLEWDTVEFENMITYADIRESIMRIPQDGEIYNLGNGIVTILMCWPEAEDYTGVNDMSIVLKIDYGTKSFLFMGDAEAYVEYALVDKEDLHSDIIKVGHHGSTSSSTTEFVKAVNPSYAIISCGKNNSYGHPRQEILDKYRNIGAKVFRTDLQGTIIIHSDGETINYETEKQVPEDEIYLEPKITITFPDNCLVGNTRTLKFHRPDCKWAATISEDNRIFFNSREEALASDYIPCGSCNP